jgi:hypothetical protein
MKTVLHFARFSAVRRLRFLLVVLFLTGSVALFWFSASADDTDNVCVVCHKQTTTLTLTCNSIDYRRHKDHGDPDGACSATSQQASLVTPTDPVAVAPLPVTNPVVVPGPVAVADTAAVTNTAPATSTAPVTNAPATSTAPVTNAAVTSTAPVTNGAVTNAVAPAVTKADAKKLEVARAAALKRAESAKRTDLSTR